MKRALAFLLVLTLCALAHAAPLCPTGQVPVCATPAVLEAPAPAPVPPPVQPPPPVPAPAPTEALFSENFESGSLDRWNAVAQQARIVTFSGRRVLEVNQAALGWGGELTRELGDREQIYVQFDWYFPSGFNGGAASGRHFWRLGGAGSFQVDNAPNAVRGNGIEFQTVSFWGPERNVFNATVLPTGRWFKFGYWFKLNTPGQSDGERSIYVDGVRVFHQPGMQFQTGNSPIQRFKLVTNFDGCSGVCGWYYDNVVIRDAIPGVP
jgi:hypothetical protein